MWRWLRRLVEDPPSRVWWRTQRLRDRVESSRFHAPLIGWPVAWLLAPVVVGIGLIAIASGQLDRQTALRVALVVLGAGSLLGSWLTLMPRIQLAGFAPSRGVDRASPRSTDASRHADDG